MFRYLFLERFIESIIVILDEKFVSWKRETFICVHIYNDFLVQLVAMINFPLLQGKNDFAKIVKI